MKKIQTFLFCLIAFSCYSQEPVKWDFAVSDIKNGELKLTIRAAKNMVVSHNIRKEGKLIITEIAIDLQGKGSASIRSTGENAWYVSSR